MKPIINKFCGMCGGEMRVAGESDGVYRIRCACCGREEDYAPEGTSAGANAGASLYGKVIGSVAEIEVSDGAASASGSGFLVRGDVIMTNRHVLTLHGSAVGETVVTVAGRRFSGRVICAGGNVDLALVRLSSAAGKPLAFADSAKLRRGDSVFVVGNSLGMGTCMTSGIVSDAARLVDGAPHIMTDAAANPGNSGGPMFDSAGRVVGVVVSGIPSAKGMSFAIPSSAAQDFLRKAAAQGVL